VVSNQPRLRRRLTSWCASRFQDVAAVREPIDCETGEAFAVEKYGPAFERQVRGHDQAVLFIRGGNDVEQQFGPGLAGGIVAAFVEDERVEFAQCLSVAMDLALHFRFEALWDEFGDAEEPDLAALGAGRLPAQPDKSIFSSPCLFALPEHLGEVHPNGAEPHRDTSPTCSDVRCQFHPGFPPESAADFNRAKSLSQNASGAEGDESAGDVEHGQVVLGFLFPANE